MMIFFLCFSRSKNINVLIKCEGLDPLTYSTKIFAKPMAQVESDEDLFENSPDQIEIQNEESDWTEKNDLDGECVLVIIIEVPNFFETKQYTLKGTILFQRYEIKYQEQIPEISLSVEEYNENKFTIKPRELINGDSPSYLTILACSVDNIAKIKIPEDMFRTLEVLLQLDCQFTKIQLEGCKIFVFDGVSQNLERSLVKIVDETTLKLITK